MAPDPQASVVIATRGRGRHLRRCLLALARQTQEPETFEVVVVLGDEPTDEATDLLASLITPFCLRPLIGSGGGPSAARNAGAEAAAGRLCIFLDEAAVAGPGLVAEHLAAHRQAPSTLGIGRLTSPGGGGWYVRQFAAGRARHHQALERGGARWTDASGANLSVSRAAFLDVGGLSLRGAAATADIELAFRLWRRGVVPVYLPRACAQHDDGRRRAQLLADRQRQGRARTELAAGAPGTLPGALGGFGATSDREIVVRRLMIALRAPPAGLAAIGPFVPGSRRQQVWYDFVSRYAFWLGVRRGVSHRRWAQLTRGVAVLMYHAFAAHAGSERFVVSGRRFAGQMRMLALLRYDVLSVSALAQLLRQNRLPPPRAVVITIDDGYRDNLDVAGPILRRRGVRSTLFLVSGRLGTGNDWDSGGELAGRALLSREAALLLREDGVELGAHTRTHPTLPHLTDAAVRAEIGGSRTDLEHELRTVVTTFSYPYGRHDERAVAAARAAGFEAALTTDPRLVRPGDDPMRIPRIEVRGTDSAWRFARKLLFGGA